MVVHQKEGGYQGTARVATVTAAASSTVAPRGVAGLGEDVGSPWPTPAPAQTYQRTHGQEPEGGKEGHRRGEQGDPGASLGR